MATYESLLAEVLNFEIDAPRHFKNIPNVCTEEYTELWVDATTLEEDLSIEESMGLYNGLQWLKEFQDGCDGIHIVTVSFLRNLHKAALKHDVKRRGYLRQQADDVVGSLCPFTDAWYRYPEPINVISKLESLCDKINILVLGWQTDKDLHVLIRMCGWFFHEFVTLHPFLDGNGRIARFVVLHLLAMLFSVPIPLFSCTRLKFLQCIVGPCINNCKPVALTQMIADCVTEFLK